MAVRLLICGGRDYGDGRAVWSVLSFIHRAKGIETLISGMAPGADTFGYEWAIANQVPALEFPADWDRYGGFAGRVRNQQMLREGKPNFIVAFPGGRGTADMVRRGKEANISMFQHRG